MGFYGSLKSTPATQLTLFIDKIYPNRYQMEKEANEDKIFIGRYILINYEEDPVDIPSDVSIGSGVESNEDKNSLIDNQLYEDTYQHTIWMKQYINEAEGYIRVGNLDAKMATITLGDPVAAWQDPTLDQFDSGFRVTLHLPRPWKFNTGEENIDIGAILFNPQWREAAGLPEEIQSLINADDFQAALQEYIGTPRLYFDTDDETSTKTLIGELRILGGLVEQAHDILYGHSGTERNTVSYNEGTDYNRDTSSLLGLYNTFRAMASEDGEEELTNVFDISNLHQFLQSLTGATKESLDIDARRIANNLKNVLTDLFQQVIGIPSDKYGDFIPELVLPNQGSEAIVNADDNLIDILNDKTEGELSDISVLLDYLARQDQEPIYNLYTLTELAKYLLAVISSMLAQVSKPDHIKAFKFNSPVGGSIVTINGNDWKENVDLHIYLEDNTKDTWFHNATGGLIVSVTMNGVDKLFAFLPKENIVDENGVRTHFNTSDSDWITWKNTIRQPQTGNPDYDDMAWITADDVANFGVGTLFTVTLFYDINGISLKEEKTLRLLAAPYYLYFFGTDDNFTITTAESKLAAIEADWAAQKEANTGWAEDEAAILAGEDAADVAFVTAYNKYIADKNAVIGDIYVPIGTTNNSIQPLKTGDILREQGVAAEISSDMNQADTEANRSKYLYIFSQFPVSKTLVQWEDTDLQEEVFAFRIRPGEGQDEIISHFVGGFEGKKIIYTDPRSKATYNYLYKSDMPDPIDRATWSSLEMIIIPEPQLEESEDPTLTLTPFIGAVDTNTTRGIMGSDGAQGVVPQPLNGDQYAYLRGDGTWSHINAVDGLLNTTNSNDELNIGHANVNHDLANIYNPIATIPAVYASPEDLANQQSSEENNNSSNQNQENSSDSSSSSNNNSDNWSSGVSDNDSSTTTYSKFSYTVISDVFKDVNSNWREVDYGPSGHKWETSTNPDFTDSEEDRTILPEEQDEKSKEKLEKVIEEFNKNCIPNETTSFRLRKTIVTSRVWDDNYNNEFQPMETVSTKYEIFHMTIDPATGEVTEEHKIESESGEAEGVDTHPVNTTALGFDSTLTIPYFQIDDYGHVIDAGVREFTFFKGQSFGVDVDAERCLLYYRYPSGLSSELFKIPVFTGVTVDNNGDMETVGKVGLVPAPGKDVTKSIAFQNEFAYETLEKNQLLIDQLINYIEGIKLHSIMSDKLSSIDNEDIVDYKADLESNNQTKIIAAMENLWNKLLTWLKDSITTMTFDDIKNNLPEQTIFEWEDLFVSAQAQAIVDLSKTPNKIFAFEDSINDYYPVDENTISFFQTNENNELIRDVILTTINNKINTIILQSIKNIINDVVAVQDNLKEKYNDYYCVLQGNGVWGPIMYDYQLVLVGSENGGWTQMNSDNTSYVTEFILPGLKERFGTFIDINMSEAKSQDDVDDLMQNWSQIDRVYVEDNKLIASCAIEHGDVPKHDIPIILKVVIR